MKRFLPLKRPALVLAPMQDVTDLPFMRVLARRGNPDWYVTEYFRVYPECRVDPYIARSLSENQTGKPLFAQLIGNHLPSLCRIADQLSQYPIAGIDLNLGCPAPVVYRKNAGGGLLRDPQALDHMIGHLRDHIQGSFTIKTRLGFETAEEFATLLDVFKRHAIDGISIHGRTVKDRYATPVHPHWVQAAKEQLSCPVIANGNVVDCKTGVEYQRITQADGLMIGRGAIRNPWIFKQLQAAFSNTTIPSYTHADLWHYMQELSAEIAQETKRYEAKSHIQRMKKTLVYIVHGLNPELEYGIFRMKTDAEFQSLGETYLNHPTPVPALPPLDSKMFCGFSALL